MATLELVESVPDLEKNVWTLEGYRTGNTEEKQFHKGLITAGHVFVALRKPDGSYLFAPSKFVGYKNNNTSHTDKKANRERLIPLSQVDQYLGPAGRIRNGTVFDFFGRP